MIVEIIIRRLGSFYKPANKMSDMNVKAVSRGNEGEDATINLVAQVIPCIMHLDYHDGEKNTVLLATASNNYQRQLST